MLLKLRYLCLILLIVIVPSIALSQSISPATLSLSLNIDKSLNALEMCESGGRDVTVLDTNKKYSIGYFQFQQATFDKYGELYSTPHDNIHSRVQQYELTKEIILHGGWRNWYNCGKSIFSQDDS